MPKRKKVIRKYGMVALGVERKIDGDTWRLAERCQNYRDALMAWGEYRAEGKGCRREIIDHGKERYYRIWVNITTPLSRRPRTLPGEHIRRRHLRIA